MSHPTPQITGSKKLHSEARAARLFGVRVHLHCYTIYTFETLTQLHEKIAI
jgi:hypothetical protein